jgi:hypothetical protein
VRRTSWVIVSAPVNVAGRQTRRLLLECDRLKRLGGATKSLGVNG